jgi:glutamate--cysteine ligase catalytic subunit
LVDIKVPIYVDKHTVLPEGTSAAESNGHIGEYIAVFPDTSLRVVAAKPGPTTPYIKMDAMAFGMGCCCLQITFQAWNVNEARRVYDALVPVAPIMVSVANAL